MGPMAEVVANSTRHLAPEDLHAMASFLSDLPPPAAAARPGPPPAAEALALGKRIYADRCAQCHGDQGLPRSENLVRMILSGGFPATTPGNPRPYGMPPFAQSLSDAEIAAVASYVRSAWGSDAPSVQALDVQKLR